MEIGWLESLLYGLLSGFTEFVPVSAQAHGAILRRLFGCGEIHFIDLMVHLACLLCLVSAIRPSLVRLLRQHKLSGGEDYRNSRQSDIIAAMDLRLVKTAATPMLLCYLVFPATERYGSEFIWMALFFVLNGLILYIPRLRPSGNKDSRMLTPMDGVLLGIFGGLSVFPGISRLGSCICAASLRGAHREYALNVALILSVPVLAALSIIDLLWLILANFAGITFILILKGILAALAAYIGTWLGIRLVRFLAVKAGYSVFAYYSWGAALFVFILYLMI